jgi:hypothetical protein
MAIATRGNDSTSFSSGIVSAGGEAVKLVVFDMGLRCGGDFSRLCLFSRLGRFSLGGPSMLNLSWGAELFRLPVGPILMRSILCLTVFSNSLFLADGK